MPSASEIAEVQKYSTESQSWPENCHWQHCCSATASAVLHLLPSKILVFLPRTFFCMFYSLPTSLSPTHANSLQDPTQARFLQEALPECTGSDTPAMPLL